MVLSGLHGRILIGPILYIVTTEQKDHSLGNCKRFEISFTWVFKVYRAKQDDGCPGSLCPRVWPVFLVIVSRCSGHIWGSFGTSVRSLLFMDCWEAVQILSGTTNAVTHCEHFPGLRLYWGLCKGPALPCQRVASWGYSVEGNKDAENNFCLVKCWEQTKPPLFSFYSCSNLCWIPGCAHLCYSINWKGRN